MKNYTIKREWTIINERRARVFNIYEDGRWLRLTFSLKEARSIVARLEKRNQTPIWMSE